MDNKIKCMFIFGTRPEIIKLAPVILSMKQRPDVFDCLLVDTGQHRELGHQALDIFNLHADISLELMSENQGVSEFLALALSKLDSIITKNSPDWVIVQGDTETALAGALAGFNHKIPVAHVEAGLRTHDLMAPYPEEGNRQMISRITSLHFAPTQGAKTLLMEEGIPQEKILVTGNTVVDAVHWIHDTFQIEGERLARSIVGNAKRVVLTTLHRRESFGEPLVGMLEAIRELALDPSLGLTFLFPVHLNPEVAHTVHAILGNQRNIKLLPPLDYKTMLALMPFSWLILTDSGGLQEEAPCFSVPVFVLRNLTERPEGIEAGIAKLIGTDKTEIIRVVKELTHDKITYQQMCSGRNPYGDGHAAQAIVDRLCAKSVHQLTG